MLMMHAVHDMQVVGAQLSDSPARCPFRACSTFHAPAMRETDWSCANCVVYATCGFAKDGAAPTSPTAGPHGASALHRQLTQIARGL